MEKTEYEFKPDFKKSNEGTLKFQERYEILQVFADLMLISQVNQRDLLQLPPENWDFEHHAVMQQLICWKINIVDIIKGSPANFYFYMDSIVFLRFSKIMFEILSEANFRIRKEDSFEQRQLKTKICFFSDLFALSIKPGPFPHKFNNLTTRYFRGEIDFENFNSIFLRENTHIPLVN